MCFRKSIFHFFFSLTILISAETLAETVVFDSLSNHRIDQTVEVDTHQVTAEFYNNYEENWVTVDNKTSYTVRFRSYQGFVAKITPHDTFRVPCEQNNIAGQMDLLSADSSAALSEQPLCGDLVQIVMEAA